MARATSCTESARTSSTTCCSASSASPEPAPPVRRPVSLAPGVPLQELENRRVLLGVEDHQLDHESPQRRLFERAQLPLQRLKLMTVLLLVFAQRAGRSGHLLVGPPTECRDRAPLRAECVPGH